MKKIFNAVLLPLLLAAYAHAATTYYVNPSTGNDGNPGTIGSPFLTVHQAAITVVCGDTILLRGGIYGHTNTLSVIYGTSTTTCSSWASPVYLRVFPGETAIMKDPGGDGSMGFSYLGNTFLVPPVTHDIYWEVHDIEFDGTGSNNASSAIGGFCVNHVHFYNVYAHLWGFDAVSARCGNGYGDPDGKYHASWDVAPADFSFYGGRISTNGQCANINPTPSECIIAGSPIVAHGLYMSVTDSVLDGVELDNNPGCGIQFTNSGSQNMNNNFLMNSYVHDNVQGHNHDGIGYCSGAEISNGSNNWLINNVFARNHQVGATVASSGTCVDCGAIGNTFYGNFGPGLQIGCAGFCSLRGIARNNISYGNSSVAIDDGGQQSSLSNNLTSVDPKFTCPGITGGCNDDYTLQSSSPAINAGISSPCGSTYGCASYVVLDKNGATRLSPPSVGAYDFGGVASPHVVSVSPVSLIQGATSQNLTFTGVGTHFDGTSVGSTACSGVTINSTMLTDPFHVVVNVTVSGGAAIATCNVSVDTGSGAEVATGPSLFSVKSSATATITSITPAVGAQGSTVSAAVVGANSHFAGGTTTCALSAPTTGMTFGTPSVSDATHLTVSITLASNVSAGVRDLTCTTMIDGAITVSNGFTVTAASLCSFFPGSPGIVTGQCVHHSNDASGSTAVVLPSLPVAVSTTPGHYAAAFVTIVKDAGGTATTNIPVSSITSARGLTYTQQCTSATNLIFQQEIWAAPVSSAGTENVTINYPANTYYSTAELIELYGLNTTNLKDLCGTSTGTSTTPSVSTSGSTTVDNDLMLAVVANFSGEIVTPDSPYTVIEQVPGNTFDFHVANIATQTASFTQPSSAFWIATILAMKPNVTTPPSVTISIASCAQLTADCQVDLTGTNTHWTSNTVPSMSNMGGITTLSFTRNSSTSATWHFSVSAGASLGIRDVTMTEASEVATASAAFAVTYTQQSRFTPFHWRF